jgi:mannose-1-phosphate guanylyltransferase
MQNNYIIIMAGGIGSRFWPTSRINQPKQFIDVLGIGRSLLQMTVDRFKNIIPSENIYIVTTANYKDLVTQQIPEIKESQIICEPCRNNTAPCIAYAAFKLFQMNSQAVVSILPADHIILDTPAFIEAIKNASNFSKNNDAIVTLGITPTRPDTGYGYIKSGVAFIDGFFKVDKFAEKPCYELAEQFIESGNYLWNAGIFVAPAATLLKSFQLHATDIFQIFDAGKDCFNSEDEEAFINREYSNCPNISFDYAIAEKATNIFTLPVSMGWSDVGTWAALHEIGIKDEDNNYIRSGIIKKYNTRNCLINGQENKLVVIKGLEDFIVVDTVDVLLIYPKNEEQGIKKVTEDLLKSTDVNWL